MSTTYNQDNTDPRLRGTGTNAEGKTVGNTSSTSAGITGDTPMGSGTTPLNPTTGQQYGQGTTTGGVIDPNVDTTAKTGTGVGEGVHARQHHDREGEFGQGTTTTGSGVVTGTGHHVSHHQGHHEHGHAPGEGLKTGCATCQGQTAPTTSTGMKGGSNPNLQPGETAVAKEAVHHGPGTTGAGAGTDTTRGTQDTTAKTGPHETGQQHIGEQGAKHHGKPTIMDKIIGGTEKGIGKMTANPAMVQKGTERAAGEFEPTKKN